MHPERRMRSSRSDVSVSGPQKLSQLKHRLQIGEPDVEEVHLPVGRAVHEHATVSSEEASRAWRERRRGS